MRWYQKMSENVRRGVRNWLQINESAPQKIQINQTVDFETSAIRNQIWARGDSSELAQLYSNTVEYADMYKFWACKSTPGMEIRKIHTGIPGLIPQVLCNVVIPDLNSPDFAVVADADLWKEIAKENKFESLLEEALNSTLIVGDGAMKMSIDTGVSQYPLLEWYPGDRVEYVYERGRLKEIVFKTLYTVKKEDYILYETYGWGYINYELTRGEVSISLEALPQTMVLKPVTFDRRLMMAAPLMVSKSAKYKGRGASIFDRKIDSFDALDEAFSQWMDALRAGRSKSYIPDRLVPRDPGSGRMLVPNAFDNRFIVTESDMTEGNKAVITTTQAAIPHDSYQATYVTALELALQGIISPSTIGIDVKKLDNAESQREKEKTTLYTRNKIVTALTDFLKEVIERSIQATDVLQMKAPREVKVDISFGEYANPSFESQIETVAKGKQGGVMSVEASVDELYGDTRSEEWKAEEVARIKTEMGIAEVEEPAVNLDQVIVQG